MSLIKTVAITGGTHGNELTGVHLIHHWHNAPKEITRGSFATELHLANPKANEINRRYIDQDLNRQFNIDDLRNSDLAGCEQQRAKELEQLLGPKHDPRVDFIIDLHTTTANMGMSLIFNTEDPLVVGMAFYVQDKMPGSTLFFDPVDRQQDSFLMSTARHNGLLIEVGPVPQGLLRADVYNATRQATQHCLDYLELVNQQEQPVQSQARDAYRFIEKVKLPETKQGDIRAMVHPNLQDQDYQPISPGDPLFMTLDGNTLYYEGSKTVFGAFINEAAYYDAHVGLSFMEKVKVSLKIDPAID